MYAPSLYIPSYIFAAIKVECGLQIIDKRHVVITKLVCLLTIQVDIRYDAWGLDSFWYTMHYC